MKSSVRKSECRGGCVQSQAAVQKARPMQQLEWRSGRTKATSQSVTHEMMHNW